MIKERLDERLQTALQDCPPSTAQEAQPEPGASSKLVGFLTTIAENFESQIRQINAIIDRIDL